MTIFRNKVACRYRAQIERLERREMLTVEALGFVPLAEAVEVGSLEETAPFALAGGFQQTLLVAQRDHPEFPVNEGIPLNDRVNGTSQFDMLTINETGPDAGRYLFRTHEVWGFCIDNTGECVGGDSGVSRTDLVTGESVVLVTRADLDRLDGIRWTPWGSLIVGEEQMVRENMNLGVFRPIPDPDHAARLGLAYEILNPLADPADVQIVVRPHLGSVAHEGIHLDRDGNVYVVDEWPEVGETERGGAIYKFVPSVPGDLSGGQLFALRTVGDRVGVAEWVPLNDATGQPIEGITDPTFDAREAADQVMATDFLRPEDVEMGVLANGNQVLYVATTTNHQLMSIELAPQPIVRRAVTRGTIDVATGMSVGEAFDEPDNLAIDSEGRIYIVEDSEPGDVWVVVDTDRDGVAESIGRWASLATPGAEPSGLYFDPFDTSVAYINVMHPTVKPKDGGIGDATFIIRRFAVGDANYDSVFNSADLVAVLQAGKYNTGEAADWTEGDWNGDGQFDTADFVTALQAGGYV